ncbi:hypothetical protein [Telmatospirillum siberiense]|nr:hypothetical protein [Telmatospirillum siberiense]
MVKMQGKTIAGLVATAMLVAVPYVPAQAHDHGRGDAIGLGLLGAAVIGSVAALAASSAPPPQQVYVAPAYAPPPQVVYAPPPTVVYAQPYYAQPRAVYYAPGYYPGY